MVATSPILSLLVIFALSLLMVRIGAVALRMTGLSTDVASFQATSAFSGAGFTTEEAEQALSTPGRRAIIRALIRLGSVGLVSVVTSLVLSFTNANGDEFRSLLFILGGVTLLLLLARSRWLNRLVTPVIEWALGRTTDLEIRDYVQLLGLESEYRVADVDVEAGDWLANETPATVSLASEGVLLLGIRRSGAYIGAPDADTEIEPGDTVVLYGKNDRLRELSERGASDQRAHRDAVEDHEHVLDEQERLLE